MKPECQKAETTDESLKVQCFTSFTAAKKLHFVEVLTSSSSNFIHLFRVPMFVWLEQYYIQWLD